MEQLTSTSSAGTCGPWAEIINQQNDISNSYDNQNKVSNVKRQNGYTLYGQYGQASLHWLSSSELDVDSSYYNPNNYRYVQTRIRLTNDGSRKGNGLGYDSDEKHLVTAYELWDNSPCATAAPTLTPTAYPTEKMGELKMTLTFDTAVDEGALKRSLATLLNVPESLISFEDARRLLASSGKSYVVGSRETQNARRWGIAGQNPI